jgi:tetratricopeptide (TPR) repeat protein
VTDTTSQGRLRRFGRRRQGVAKPPRKLGLAGQLDELRSIEAWALRQRGIRLLHVAAAREVLDDFGRAVGASMKRHAGLAALGDPMIENTSVVSAVDCLAQAAEIAGPDLTGRFLVADHLIRAGQPDDALALSTHLPGDLRARAIAFWVRGRALAARGRRVRAAVSYRRALRRMPAFREARSAFADLLWEFGRPAEAGEHDLAALWTPPLGLVPPLPGATAPLDVLQEMRYWELGGDASLVEPDISLIEESVNGFNIAFCAGMYYGIPQSLGPVSLSDLAPRAQKPLRRRFVATVLTLPLRSPVGLAAWGLARGLLPDGIRDRLRRTRLAAAPIFSGGTIPEVKLRIAIHLKGQQPPSSRKKA